MVLNLVSKRTSPGGAGITVTEISEALEVTAPTITQLINSLEAGGFVERGGDPTDRRAVRITLTTRGEAALKKDLDAFFSAFDGLVDYLGEEDSLSLARLLARVFDFFSSHRPVS
jgi:DNA-binding MarR family transcriptional regulator